MKTKTFLFSSIVVVLFFVAVFYLSFVSEDGNKKYEPVLGRDNSCLTNISSKAKTHKKIKKNLKNKLAYKNNDNNIPQFENDTYRNNRQDNISDGRNIPNSKNISNSDRGKRKKIAETNNFDKKKSNNKNKNKKAFVDENEDKNYSYIGSLKILDTGQIANSDLLNQELKIEEAELSNEIEKGEKKDSDSKESDSEDIEYKDDYDFLLEEEDIKFLFKNNILDIDTFIKLKNVTEGVVYKKKIVIDGKVYYK